MTLDQVRSKLAAINGPRLARAEQAIAAGIAFVIDKTTGKKVAIVGSKSGNGSYIVKGTGCNCRGFVNHGYCAHSDAVYIAIAARAQQKEAASAVSEARAERQPNGDLFILDCDTGALLGVVSPIETETETPSDVVPEFEQWLSDLSTAMDEMTGYATPTMAGRRVEEY